MRVELHRKATYTVRVSGTPHELPYEYVSVLHCHLDSLIEILNLHKGLTAQNGFSLLIVFLLLFVRFERVQQIAFGEHEMRLGAGH